MRLASIALLAVASSFGVLACQSSRAPQPAPSSVYEPHMEVVALRFANAAEVSGALGAALQDTLLRVRSYERTNSVILVGPLESVARAKGLIAKLDIEVK